VAPDRLDDFFVALDEALMAQGFLEAPDA
jgi:hypothetical protein